jgi:hypothetical protein
MAAIYRWSLYPDLVPFERLHYPFNVPQFQSGELSKGPGMKLLSHCPHRCNAMEYVTGANLGFGCDHG